MIQDYEFIDINGDGEKERQTGATVQLYNKLSAEETNNFKDKLNEVIAAVNFNAIPLFPQFILKFKGPGNLDNFNLEPGDIVHGFYDADTIWDNATYDGGDPEDKENYTRILSTFEPIIFTSTGSSNVFALTPGMKANNVFIDRGVRYFGTEWDQVGDNVEIQGATLAAGKKIYVTP